MIFSGQYKPRHAESVYAEIIRKAGSSFPRPTQSEYYVRAAVKDTKGNIYIGGNQEYAITDAVHGEETAIVSALSHDPKSKIDTIAFWDPNFLGSPCGNCRDVIREFATENAEVVVGNGSGRFLIQPFTKLLYDAFDPITLARGQLGQGIESAAVALRNSYDIYVPDKKKLYGAALLTNKGIFRGSFDGDAAYDPVLPIRSAILNLKHNADFEDLSIERLVIASGQVPEVPYKDRQSLFDFQEQLCDSPLEVVLVEVDMRKNPIGSWLTNSMQWLPQPFGPATLGMNEQLTEYRQRLFTVPAPKTRVRRENGELRLHLADSQLSEDI